MISEKTIKFLSETSLFSELSTEEIKQILPCLMARTKSYDKGDQLLRIGDPVNEMGILLSGKLSIEHDDLWGNKTMLNLVEPGNVFAETFACISGSKSLVNVVALSNSVILTLNSNHILNTCCNNCPFHSKIIRNLLTISAMKNINLSSRSIHTGAKTIRGRLLSYLSYEMTNNGSYEFDIPFNRQQLADYLNIDRSALSNELSKMTKDGYISVHKNHFILKTM